MITHSLWLHWNKLKQFYVHVEKMIQNQICSLIFLRCLPVQTRFPAGILPCLDEMITLLLVLLAFVQFEWAPGKDWKQAFVMGEGNRNVRDTTKDHCLFEARRGLSWHVCKGSLSILHLYKHTQWLIQQTNSV